MNAIMRDDRARLAAIMMEPDDRRQVALIREYWRDADRSDRTPREFLYLHLGILAGTCERLLGEATVH